ncbi:hypothetical protein MRX96_052381 [Rhipicephalus microplus]
MARAVLLLHPDSRGPVMFSQDSTHDLWSFRCGIHQRSGFSWHSAPTCFAVSLLSPRSRKFWSWRLAVLSSLTKPGRFLHAPTSETIAGDVATVETAWPYPAQHLSAAATPDASLVGPAGLLPRATRGLLHARSSRTTLLAAEAQPSGSFPADQVVGTRAMRNNQLASA